MHENTKIKEEQNLEYILSKIKLIETNENIPDTKEVQVYLSKSFYKNTDVSESTNILKTVLKLIKIGNVDPSLYIKGISKHIKNPLSPLYEHSIILMASLYKDSSFNFTGFTEIHKFKDLMPKECFEKKCNEKLKTKFDDKVKINIYPSIFSRKNPVNYLQEGIQILKDENRDRLDEAFNKMQSLIENSSDRVIKYRCLDYFEVILSYDGYDLIKSDIILALLNRAFETLHKEIIEYIFGDKICLRFKICLVNVLIKLSENHLTSLDRIRKIFVMLIDKVNDRQNDTNRLILYNLKYLLEICEYKLK